METHIQGYQLSLQQSQFWAQQAVAHGLWAQCTVALHGPLNHTLLQASIHDVVHRHDMLRTTLQLPIGMKSPLQVVVETYEPVLDVHDLRHLTCNQQQDWIIDRLGQARTDPIIHEPLLKFWLVQVNEQQHTLMTHLSALYADQWTLHTLIKEIANCYTARVNHDVRDDELLQYVQYSEWQREMASEEEAVAGTDYWRTRGITARSQLKLPFADRSLPPHQATWDVVTAVEAHAHIQLFAEQAKISVEAVCFACWQVLLWIRTQQPTMTTHVLVDGRQDEELLEALGLFATSLPVLGQFEPHMRFDELLEQTQHLLQQIREWQEYVYFADLDLTGNDTYQDQILFSLLPERLTYNAGGIEWQMTQQFVYTHACLMHMACCPTKQGLEIALFYDAQRIPQSEICSLVEQFQTLLTQVLSTPTTAIQALSIISEHERQRLLTDWNDTAVTYPDTSCVHELFTAQAQRTPAAQAVVYHHQSLTYAELDAQSNQLARHLQSMGVRASMHVGLLLERSPDMVVAILGVLKAGGVYVPIEPTFPRERINYVLSDTASSIVITQEHLKARIADCGVQCVTIESNHSIIAQQPTTPVETAVTTKHLAYIIYTSGSTGKPKGAMITHKGLVNYLSWCIANYEVADGHGAPVHSPLTFDLTITSLFAPLLAGRTLTLLPETQGGAALTTTLTDSHNYSLVKLTPAHLDLLSQTLAPDAADSARVYVIGGEALRYASLSFWQTHAPSVRLINEYGPTETVVGCCTYDAVGEQITAGQVPIGRPIANTQLYVLDGQMDLVPIGCIGELFIGGDGLAQGYLNQPDQTATAFVPHPFSTIDGARLYKTGDLVRYRADGILEFHGRRDHQVKIRGYRIELGEIESTLGQHPAVRDVVVIDREDVPGDRRLVAYIVPHHEQHHIAEIRSFLQTQLPEYMIPASFVELDTLPLTPNGKVDRHALPESQDRSALDDQWAMPRTPIETAITAIWQQVLKRDQVSIYADFLDLGGHSLLATQVIAQISDTMGVALPVRAFFDNATVAGLATLVEQAQRESHGLSVAPIEPVARNQTLPASFAQQRLWFLEQFETGTTAYHQLAALRIVGDLDVQVLQHSFQDLLQRHEILRTTFVSQNNQVVQVIAPEQTLSFGIIDIRDHSTEVREEQIQQHITHAMKTPFDLAQGPLFRTILLHVADQSYVLLVSIHHIISDEWSVRILMRDFQALYESRVTGQPHGLPDLPVQYADFSVWQRKQLTGQALDAQLDYWRQQLGDQPPSLQLPTRKTIEMSVSNRAALHHLALSDKLGEQLRTLGHQEKVTLFMIFLAGFQIVLHYYARQEEILIGTPIANRSRAEVAQLIGPLINTLVLRGNLAHNPTFRSLLAQARTTALGAYAHQDIPYEKLVDELQADSARGTSFFRVWLVFEQDMLPEMTLPGLTIQPLEVESGEARHDIRLFLRHTVDGIATEWEYRADLFHQSTIQSMAYLFAITLETVSAQPDQELCSILDTLAAAEQQQHLEQAQNLAATSRQMLRRRRQSTANEQKET
ncbi:MAG: amino acid adenylation domain-containing protein [Chloroflexota bacterium]